MEGNQRVDKLLMQSLSSEDFLDMLEQRREEILANRVQNLISLVNRCLKMDTMALRGTGLTDSILIELVLPMLTKFANESSWTTLDLRWNQLTPACAKQLARTLNQLANSGRPVQAFLLDQNHLGDSGVQDLLDTLSDQALAGLEVLSLIDNHVTDRGAEAIAKLLPHSNIEALLLDNNQLSDSGLGAVANNLPESKVTNLSLSNLPKVTEKGFQLIVSILSKTRLLTSLNLSQNQLSDDTASLIAKVSMRSNLRHLNLALSTLTEKGLQAFVPALKHSNLEFLDFSGNELTQDLADKMTEIVTIKKSNWFRSIQALLSAACIQRIGKHAPISILPIELFGEIAKASAPKDVAGIVQPRFPTAILNIFLMLPQHVEETGETNDQETQQQ